jgi:hypothetical protein
MKAKVQIYMWQVVCIIAVSVFTLTGAAEAQERPITYYVQLVRGTDSDQPPQSGSRLVGAKLAEKFHSVFKWKHYWEINQRKVEVNPGRSARVDLANGRAVEIDLRAGNQRTVAAFENGKLLDRTVGPMGGGMTFIGGNRDQKSAWFLVVRRDKPGA